MAPLAEARITSTPAQALPSYEAPPKPPLDRKTVAFAVNYEPSMVDRYWATASYAPTSKTVKLVPASTRRTTRKPAYVEDEQVSNDQATTENGKVSRRSAREQKQRSVNMTSTRVRYDMELVPLVERHPEFWDSVKSWPPRATKKRCRETLSFNGPFDKSVLWKPETRKEWEDSVSELTAVCTSAALRKWDPSKSPKKAFVPPLSREYIRDRIDIDDPLRGYQIRHKTGGWLQGFILWTNFTTWTHYFTWDSLHEQSGMTSMDHAKDDLEGSLAKELESMTRHGDPSDSGIVFQNIAEIALLGGLGCGELLLRMALEDIRKHSQYKYVVLQATSESRSFYELFGFVRVGAVCRYGSYVTAKGMQSHSLAVPTLDTPVQGYRHWTHANESQHSLDLHGGPSYMMCLKLPETEDESNLLELMRDYTVEKKPSVEALGAASTPAPKRRMKKFSTPVSISPELPTLTTSPSLPSIITGSTDYKRVHDDSSSDGAKKKRRKVSEDRIELDITPTPSIEDQNIQPQNQYHSVWLSGVPSDKPNSRKVARQRSNSTNKCSSPKTKKAIKVKTPSATQPISPSPVHHQVVPSSDIQPVDRATLCKQKVKSYPRDRLHFYNKVVQRKGTTDGPYYFVLHYSESSQQLTLCPMAPKGILSGKRQGRPRFQCMLEETSANWITSPTSEFEPIPAFMVMKTPLVAQEAWDILGEP